MLASFDGAPSGEGPFRIATNTGDVVGNVGAGFDVLGTDGTSFRLYYEGRFGDIVEQHAAGIKGTLPF
jgi:hypothetical protein